MTIKGLTKREYFKQYYEQHKEFALAYQKDYNETHKQQKRDYDKIHMNKRNHETPQKTVYATRLALRKIPLKECCEVCGSTENLERHHFDYSKPLEILCVCRNCHAKIHSILRE